MSTSRGGGRRARRLLCVGAGCSFVGAFVVPRGGPLATRRGAGVKGADDNDFGFCDAETPGGAPCVDAAAFWDVDNQRDPKKAAAGEGVSSSSFEEEEDGFCDPFDSAASSTCVDLGDVFEVKTKAAATGEYCDGSATTAAGCVDPIVVGAEDGAECDPAAPASMDCVDANAYWDVAEEVDYKALDSHLTVERDSAGLPLREAFTFVDERSCIGCVACAQIAPSTFYMEEGDGLARVFRQHGDPDLAIEDAIAACPVDCIKSVNLATLERLEQTRAANTITQAARLVARAEGRKPRTVIDPKGIVDPTDADLLQRERIKEKARIDQLKKSLPSSYSKEREL